MVRIPTAVFLCAAALVLGGCETARNLNPFAEKDEVIPGERQPVFGPDSGFDGPRKLPPPNSDYVGATIRADQPVPPSQPATGTMGVETAPGVGAQQSPVIAAPPASSAPASPRAEPLPVPPPPQ